MPSERVTRILLSNSDLTRDGITGLSEAQAWRLVYSLPKPERDNRVEVCFTGFGASEKLRLSQLAETANLKVAKSVTKGLSLLVCGPNAGPAKLEQAGAQGVVLLESAEFEIFLQTGEVPDPSTA